MNPENSKPSRKTSKAKSASSSRSEAIKRNLPALAAGAGVEVAAGGDTRLPALDITQTVRALAREMGMLLRDTALFVRANVFVTVDGATGEVKTMTAERFCSYVERIAWTFKPQKDGPVFSRLGVDLARVILACDDFRAHVRELRCVSLVRLPAWRGEGEARTMELLQPGYDEATGIFTLDTVPYDENADAGEAQSWLLNYVLAGYPWADAENGLGKSRNVSVLVAGMLTPFCAFLLPDEAMRPMLVVLANQRGAGKSTLAKMMLAPVHGIPAATNADKKEQELENQINSALLAQSPYLFLDNMSNFKSGTLAMMLTSPRVAVRKLGSSDMPKLPNKTLVVMTGIAVNIGDELVRRALVLDLFCPREATERRFDHEITDTWLNRPDIRARFLAALWAFVRHWRDTDHMKRYAEAWRASYEAHASLVGSILLSLGMANPYAKREYGMGGDEQGEALMELLRDVAENIPDGGSEDWTLKRIIELADERGLLAGC